MSQGAVSLLSHTVFPRSFKVFSYYNFKYMFTYEGN